MAFLNEAVLNYLFSSLYIYTAANTAENDNGEPITYIFIETLREIIPNRLPAGVLRLSIKIPVILIRNLYPREGLCNGTKLLIIRISQFCIETKIFNETKYKKIQLIPRIFFNF